MRQLTPLHQHYFTSKETEPREVKSLCVSHQMVIESRLESCTIPLNSYPINQSVTIYREMIVEKIHTLPSERLINSVSPQSSTKNLFSFLWDLYFNYFSLYYFNYSCCSLFASTSSQHYQNFRCSYLLTTSGDVFWEELVMSVSIHRSQKVQNFSA